MTWPTDRPGYPRDAERDGWHWIATLPNIVPTPWRWWPDSESDGGGDWRAPGSRWATPLRNMQRYHYLGPCYTQADLDAAVQAEREACLSVVKSRAEHMNNFAIAWASDAARNTASHIEAIETAIRARGPTSALDAALAQARRETWEKAAEIAKAHTKAPGQRNAKDQWRESIGVEIAAALSAAAGEEGK